MKQKQITAENANDGQLRLLYETAFPKEEQIPWDDLVRLIGEMNLDFESGFSRMLMIRFDVEHLTGKKAIELVRQRNI